MKDKYTDFLASLHTQNGTEQERDALAQDAAQAFQTDLFLFALKKLAEIAEIEAQNAQGTLMQEETARFKMAVDDVLLQMDGVREGPAIMAADDAGSIATRTGQIIHDIQYGCEFNQEKIVFFDDNVAGKPCEISSLTSDIATLLNCNNPTDLRTMIRHSLPQSKDGASQRISGHIMEFVSPYISADANKACRLWDKQIVSSTAAIKFWDHKMWVTREYPVNKHYIAFLDNAREERRRFLGKPGAAEKPELK